VISGDQKTGRGAMRIDLIDIDGGMRKVRKYRRKRHPKKPTIWKKNLLQVSTELKFDAKNNVLDTRKRNCRQ